MITIEHRPHCLVLRNTETGQGMAVAIADVPAMLAGILAELGVQGTRFQQGYRAGFIAGKGDGRIEGYAARDREYIIAATKDRERFARAALIAVCDEATAA